MGLERLYDQARRIKVDPMWRKEWEDRIESIAAMVERFIPDDISEIGME